MYLLKKQQAVFVYKTLPYISCDPYNGGESGFYFFLIVNRLLMQHYFMHACKKFKCLQSCCILRRKGLGSS